MKVQVLKVALCLTLATSIFASTCSDSYNEKLIKVNNSKTMRRTRNGHNNMHIVTAIGLNSVVGIAALPSFFAYPLYVLAKKSYRNKLEFYKALYGNTDDAQNGAFLEILLELQEDGLDVSFDSIREELALLNESGQLCDGTIFTNYASQYNRGRGERQERVADTVPSKRKLINYLSDKL